MSPDPSHDREESSPAARAADRFGDEYYPAYTMGRAAEILGVTATFLRSLDEANLIQPQRSVGGHRRYSRDQLRTAGRVRELLDEGINLDAAWRIITLQDQLHNAQDTQNRSDQRRPSRRANPDSP